MARHLPHVVTDADMSDIRTEVRRFNLLPAEKRPSKTSETTIAQAWQQVRELKDTSGEHQAFPLLSVISSASSTLFMEMQMSRERLEKCMM